MKTIKDLGMSEEQAVVEIDFMRGFDKYLRRALGDDVYGKLCMRYARERTAESLRKLGATEEEIKDACDFAESTMGARYETTIN